MKPFKDRVHLYFLILLSVVLITLGLLITGKDYRKGRGFYDAADREAMSLSEALHALPERLIYPLLAFVGCILLIELTVAIIAYFKR